LPSTSRKKKKNNDRSKRGWEGREISEWTSASPGPITCERESALAFGNRVFRVFRPRIRNHVCGNWGGKNMLKREQTGSKAIARDKRKRFSCCPRETRCEQGSHKNKTSAQTPFLTDGGGETSQGRGRPNLKRGRGGETVLSGDQSSKARGPAIRQKTA